MTGPPPGADHDLVALLVTGMTSGEIAERLGTDSGEVERRITDLLAALEFRSRADLLFAAALGRI